MAESKLNVLHIFNGDSTKFLFDKSDISGARMVWREMLCEGPTKEIIDKEFWKIRKRFLHDKFNIPVEKYLDFIENEIENYEFNNFGQIILWFEYDLFCQVNLWAVISFISQQNFKGKIALVDMTPHQKEDRFVGLGEIEFHHYNDLEKGAQTLQQQDIALAQKLWHIWCDDPSHLFISFKETRTKIFPCLPEAIQALQSLLPKWERGLSILELKIIDFVQSKQPTWQSIMNNVLENNTHLGWGDTQYEHLLKKMEYLFEINDDTYSLKAGIKEEIKSNKAFHIPRNYGGYSNI